MKYLLLFCLLLSALFSQAQLSYFYVGSATDTITDPIALCFIDLSTGHLEKVASFTGTKSSSYLCLSSDRKYLYAINSKGIPADETSHSVTAFMVDPKTMALTLLNSQSVQGKGACHLSLTHDDKYLMVANYGSGNVVVLPVNNDGSLSPVVSNKRHAGSGPNKKRQQQPHAHYIQPSPDDNYVFAVDLGIDKVMVYKLDENTGELSENTNQAFLKLPAGAGPRHIIFHANGKNAYILNELSSSISACRYDAKKGVLSIIETHPMLPADFTAFSKAAAIRISPNGRHLYGSNRGHESIAVFGIRGNMNIKRRQIMTDGIEWPRDYNIDATGKYMVVANRYKNLLRSYRMSRKGKLVMTDNTLEIAQPTSIVFVND